jgi:TPR repeat protein
MELYTRAVALGNRKACYNLADAYYTRGDLKKARFHIEAAAMAGHEVARFNLGTMEVESGNIERAIKHWIIAASAGFHSAMQNLLVALGKRYISHETIESTLKAYNNSCAEMRSKARDAYIAIHLLPKSVSD